MANPLNHVRWQRPLAVLFLALVLAGLVAGGVRALRSAPPQPRATHHATAHAHRALS